MYADFYITVRCCLLLIVSLPLFDCMTDSLSPPILPPILRTYDLYVRTHRMQAEQTADRRPPRAPRRRLLRPISRSHLPPREEQHIL